MSRPPPWVRRPEFEKQSSLVINYAVAQCAEWDEACVAARAEQLAEAACRVWPPPTTLVADA